MIIIRFLIGIHFRLIFVYFVSISCLIAHRHVYGLMYSICHCHLMLMPFFFSSVEKQLLLFVVDNFSYQSRIVAYECYWVT